MRVDLEKKTPARGQRRDRDGGSWFYRIGSAGRSGVYAIHGYHTRKC